jgi:chromosome segregation ATPase
MKANGFGNTNKLRHSLKNFGKNNLGREQFIQTMNIRLNDLQKKINRVQLEKQQLEKENKMMNFQLEEMNEKLIQQEDQINEQDEQLQEVEVELEDVNMMKGTLEEQKYELMRKSEEIKQLNKRISELKQDVFYRNKNVFDHNLLKMELDHQKKESEALRGRIKQLEESCATMRIKAEVTGEDPVETENHFTKKIFKLESIINEMKRENEELRKVSKSQGNNLLSSMISNKSSQQDFYTKKKLRYNQRSVNNEIPENEGTNEKISELKEKISQVQMEKKIYMNKNEELLNEIENLRNKNIKKEKIANNSLIDDKEFKKRLIKLRKENHDLKDQLYEMETKLRNWETEHRLNNDKSKSKIDNMSGKDNEEIEELKRTIEKKEKEIDNLKKERNLLKKEIDQLKFEMEEKEKEVKTLEYRLIGEEDNDNKVNQLLQKNSKLGERIMELESQIKRMLEMQSMNSSGYPDKELEKILNE